jgi:hypothetical protein
MSQRPPGRAGFRSGEATTNAGREGERPRPLGRARAHTGPFALAEPEAPAAARSDACGTTEPAGANSRWGSGGGRDSEVAAVDEPRPPEA